MLSNAVIAPGYYSKATEITPNLISDTMSKKLLNKVVDGTLIVEMPIPQCERRMAEKQVNLMCYMWIQIQRRIWAVFIDERRDDSNQVIDVWVQFCVNARRWVWLNLQTHEEWYEGHEDSCLHHPRETTSSIEGHAMKVWWSWRSW